MADALAALSHLNHIGYMPMGTHLFAAFLHLHVYWVYVGGCM